MTAPSLADIGIALSDIKQRLEKVEARLGIAEPPPEPEPQAKREESVRPEPGQTHASIADRPARDLQQATQKSGGAWLGAAGVLFFVLAATFFIKLAIDAGWLTPVRQIGGAFMFGALLIAAGFRLKGKDAAFASYLPAAGVVVFFLSAYASYVVFELSSHTGSLVLCSLISIFSLYLFTEFQHGFFLVSAIFGSYCIPLLFGTGQHDRISNEVYFVLWDILYCICAIVLGERLLIGLTAYFAIGVYFLNEVLSSGQPDHQLMQQVLSFQMFQFVLLSAAVGLFSAVRKESMRSSEAWALFPVLMLFYVTEYFMIEQIAPDFAPWSSVCFALIVFGIYFLATRYLKQDTLESEPMVLTFVCLCLTHAFYLELLPESAGPWIGIGIMLLLASLSRERFPTERFWPVYFILLAIVGSEYLKILNTSDYSLSFQGVFMNAIYGAACFVAFFESRKAKPLGFILIAGIIQALCGLYQLAHLLAPAGLAVYLTSGLWALLALSLLFLAYSFKDRKIAKSAVSLFGVVAVKVLFNDISESGSVGRIVALIVVGALLYAGGILLRKINQWQPE